MYKQSEDFNTAILGDNRKFYTKMVLGSMEIIDAVKNVKKYSQVVGSNMFSIGGAISSYVTMDIWQPGFQIEGKEFEVLIGIDTASGTEWCSLGKYTANVPKTSIDGMISVTAYDRIQSKLSGAYFSNLTYPTDAKNILNEISAMTGVPIVTDDIDSGVMVNKVVSSVENSVDENGNQTTTTNYSDPFDGYTYREVLGYVAMLYCRYAVADRDGSIKFVWYEDNGYVLSADRYYNDFTTGEVVFEVGTISCNTVSGELLAGSGTTNVQLENPVMTQERLNYIYNQVKGLQFIPVSLSFLGDSRVEAADIVSMVRSDGTVYRVPVMNLTHDFDGGLKTTVQSYGGVEQENTVKGPTMTRLDRQYAELFLVKELVGKKASFDYVYALSGEFKNLKAEFAEFDLAIAKELRAVNAEIENVKANNITTENLDAALAEIDVLTVGTADLKYATIENLNVLSGNFETLSAKAITTENLSVLVADLGYATVKQLEAVDGKIENLDSVYIKTENLSAEVAKLGYATVKELEAIEGRFESLTSDYLDVRLSNIDTANIDKAVIATMFVELGLINTAVIENGHITGYLDSVSINANAIKAGTLSVDRLVINGSKESLIFALNNAGELVSTSVDTLDGGLLTDRTITSDKIVAHSITANEITTSNIIGSSGWINLAQGTFNYGNQLTWDGKNLFINAKSITSVTDGLYASADMEIGGRNLIRNSRTLDFKDYSFDEKYLTDENGKSLVDEANVILIA